MGESHSKHQNNNDDAYYYYDDDDIYFSATDDDEEEVFGISDDETLAEELQLQEFLFGEKSIWSSVCMDESCSICPRIAAPSLDEEAYCNICMELKPLQQFLDIKFCSHKFCLSCLNLYVSAKLDDNVSNIGCPEPGCREGVLEPLILQFVLPSGTFKRWCDNLCQSMIKAKFYCPFNECSALLEAGDGDDDDEEEVITVSECPHCNRLFCAQCKVPWHPGIDCKEFQRLIGDERGKEDRLLRELAAKLRWQRCPHCGITVERLDGCRFMRCRCGHCFCYICASPMSQEDHYCYNCKG